MRTIIGILLLLTATRSHGQDLSGFERVLFPVVTSPWGSISGANGARFSASAFAMTDRSDVRYFPQYDQFTGEASTGIFFALGFHPLFNYGPASRVGRILYVDRISSDAITFGATLTSTRTDSESANHTRLPVVRERDFRTTTARIIAVTSSAMYEPGTCPRHYKHQLRHTLRIYDIDARGDARVQVKTFQESSPGAAPPTAQFTVEISSRESSDPSYPSFAEVVIDEVCRPLSCHSPCQPDSQRVEIVPLTPGLRFWAMVSATDNVTQQVSVAYPQ